MLGNTLVGSIVGSGAGVTYKAPAKDANLACVPSENPVLIQVFFADRAAAGPTTDFLKARVGVLARNWSFDYSLERNVTCSSPVPNGSAGPIERIDIVGLEGSSFVDTGDAYAPLHLKFLLQDPGDPSFTITCPALRQSSPNRP